MHNPVGKITEKAVCKSVFLTIWHCINALCQTVYLAILPIPDKCYRNFSFNSTITVIIHAAIFMKIIVIKFAIINHFNPFKFQAHF